MTYHRVTFKINKDKIETAARQAYPRRKTQARQIQGLTDDLGSFSQSLVVDVADGEEEKIIPTAIAAYKQTKLGNLFYHPEDYTITAAPARTGLGEALEFLSKMVESGDRAIQQFCKDLQGTEYPTREMSWSNGVFEKIATRDVAKEWAIVMKDNGLTKTLEQMRAKVLERARYVSQSTSPTSNLNEQYITSAIAKLAQEMSWYDRFDELLAKDAIKA